MTQDMIEQHTKQGEIVMYQPDETIRLEVRLENDTVWLTQVRENYRKQVICRFCIILCQSSNPQRYII